MEIQSFNQELQLANGLFKRLFNNISIVSSGKTIKFRCVLGSRSRIFKSLENPTRDSEYTLPLIVIERTGITKNTDRITNINNEVKHQVYPKKLTYDIFTPVPIDIAYQVTIISKYQDHIDKCISNFIPFFNNDLFVRYEHPKFENVFYTSQIVMNDSIDMDRPIEITGSDDDIITCTTSFVFKTYMFCGTNKAKETDVRHVVKTYLSAGVILSSIVDTVYSGFVPQIKQINMGFYPVPYDQSYSDQFNFVDSLSGDDEYSTMKLQEPLVDRFIWKIDESGNMSHISSI